MILDVLTGAAGGYDDLCASRSFALVAMHGALRSAVDTVRYALPEDKASAEIQRLYAKHDAAALVKALENEDDWYVEESWMKKNIDRFIKSSELVERRNNVGDEELSRRAVAIENEFGGTLYTNQSHLWGPRRWAALPQLHAARDRGGPQVGRTPRRGPRVGHDRARRLVRAPRDGVTTARA
jgi:hypothetical protein